MKILITTAVENSKSTINTINLLETNNQVFIDKFNELGVDFSIGEFYTAQGFCGLICNDFKITYYKKTFCTISFSALLRELYKIDENILVNFDLEIM